MERLKTLILFVWQLPQNLLGALLRVIYRGEDCTYKGATVRRCDYMRGGISLGKYIIVGCNAGDNTIMHKYGHCKQSLRLGWLYLLIVGLPSILWAASYGLLIKPTTNGYYLFYTEYWADKLGGVER